MAPDRRLDQLEPLMADSLQKIDRLIEGQSHLIEVATRADQNADTAARGVVDLTASTQQQFEQLKVGQDMAARGVANLTVSTQQQFEQLKAGQEGLKTNVELILQLLREKLP